MMEHHLDQENNHQQDSIDQLDHQPLSYIETLGDIVENQNSNGIDSSEQRDSFVVPTHNIPTQSGILTEITAQRRMLFILFGIGFLFSGTGAITLEVLIIINSYSSYLCGFWTGNMMLGTGIILIIIAGRKSQLFSTVVHLLLFTLSTNTAGIVFSGLELIATRQCIYSNNQNICDSEIGGILKLVMVGELNLSVFYNTIVISYIWRIKRISTLPSVPSDDYYTY